MSLELLIPIGLLAATVAAFAISSLVGMLVARLWVTPRLDSGAHGEPGVWQLRPDPAHPDPAGGRPAETLGSVAGPIA